MYIAHIHLVKYQLGPRIPPMCLHVPVFRLTFSGSLEFCCDFGNLFLSYRLANGMQSKWKHRALARDLHITTMSIMFKCRLLLNLARFMRRRHTQWFTMIREFQAGQRLIDSLTLNSNSASFVWPAKLSLGSQYLIVERNSEVKLPTHGLMQQQLWEQS